MEREAVPLSTVFTLYNKFFGKKKKKIPIENGSWKVKNEIYILRNARLVVFKSSFEYNWLRLIQWILQIYFVTRLRRRRRSLCQSRLRYRSFARHRDISRDTFRFRTRTRPFHQNFGNCRRVKRTLEMKSRNTTCLISEISHARGDSRLWNANNKTNITSLIIYLNNNLKFVGKSFLDNLIFPMKCKLVRSDSLSLFFFFLQREPSFAELSSIYR